MKTPLTFLLSLTTHLLLIATPVIASSESIVLVCNYEYTVDDSGQSSPTSGSPTYTITFLNDLDIIVKKNGLGALLRGKQSKDEFNAMVIYEIPGVKIRESISINRYSGKIEAMFGSPGSSKGLVHYGQCARKKDKLF
jgi:hypothetical protein